MSGLLWTLSGALMVGMLELIMQAFCRPPYSTVKNKQTNFNVRVQDRKSSPVRSGPVRPAVKWPASRQTRFLHLGFRGEAARVTTCKHGEAACYRDRLRAGGRSQHSGITVLLHLMPDTWIRMVV